MKCNILLRKFECDSINKDENVHRYAGRGERERREREREKGEREREKRERILWKITNLA